MHPAYRTPEYLAMKAWVKATHPRCWVDGLPGADSVDHVPPLATFSHWTLWVGELRPVHLSCNARAGQALGASRRVKRKLTPAQKAARDAYFRAGYLNPGSPGTIRRAGNPPTRGRGNR